MKMVEESEKALLNALTSEKRHLELSLKESENVKEQYKIKCDESQASFENLFKEVMVLKRQKIAVDEIKRDRDQRLKLCRDEIDYLENQVQTLEKEHAALQVNYDSTYAENIKMTAENKSMSENLTLANKVRNDSETKLTELTKQYNVLK
jgi:regulator of replication initiation timing